jgi:GWxTD domain-containing protein
MRKNLTIMAVIAIVFASCAVPVVAQDELASGTAEAVAAVDSLRWDEGPAGFLMTKGDKKEWKKITSEAQAEQFIELFWAKRNPDPTAPFNSFKAQFESRVRYADENFSYEGRRGALTDRGRVLIVMGSPHQAERRAATEFVQSMDDNPGGTDEVRAEAAMWLYDPARLPEGMNIKGSRLLYVFYEERPGTNNFVLDRSHQDATMGMRALGKAPEAYVLHPKLTEVPKPVAVPGANAATAAHLDWLAVPSAPWSDRAIILSQLGLADAAHRPYWLHVELPSDAPTLDLFAGRVLSADGEVMSTFEKEIVPLEFEGRSAYHLTFPLEAGSYRVEVVGAAGPEPQVLHAEDVTIPEVPGEGTWLSDILVGLHAEQKQDAMLGSAYCLGQLHVLPISTPEVTRKNEISFFGFLVRPQESTDGKAAITSKIQLKRDGRRFGRPLDMPMEAIQVSDEVFVYANGISLGALPETGEYIMEFTVTDPVSETSVEREVELNVTE